MGLGTGLDVCAVPGGLPELAGTGGSIPRDSWCSQPRAAGPLGSSIPSAGAAWASNIWPAASRVCWPPANKVARVEFLLLFLAPHPGPYAGGNLSLASFIVFLVYSQARPAGFFHPGPGD